MILLVAGLALMFWDKFPFRRIPRGRLLGDILVQNPGVTLYIPWVTGLVISLVVSLIYALLKKQPGRRLAPTFSTRVKI